LTRKKTAKKRARKPETEVVTTPTGSITVVMRGGPVVDDAMRLEVTDQRSADQAGEMRHAIAALIEEVHGDFDEHCATANKLHKGLTATRKRHLDPLAAADTALANRIEAWATREQTRRIAEALVAAEHEKGARAVDAAVQIEELTAQGIDRDIATDVVESVGTPSADPEPVAVAGHSVGDVVDYEIEDLTKFFEAIGLGELPLGLAKPDEKGLKGYAKAHGRAGSIRGTLRIFQRAAVRKSRKT